ncbi:MAG: hypothetical protein FJ040_03315 [Chloroflexi bacterium]|nr:hypothetical protein [Chloroflexota bacterium]
MQQQLLDADQWSTFVAMLVNRVSPMLQPADVIDTLGTSALYVMSEEWWDPSTIDVHPRMVKQPVSALRSLRQRQLLRLRQLGVQVSLTWHAGIDEALASHINSAIDSGELVGVYGIAGRQFALVHSFQNGVMKIQRGADHVDVVDPATLRTPGGIQCVTCDICARDIVKPYEHVEWTYELLFSTSSVAFDTPGHPIRDWQVWHIGVDAFAVAAFSAETAAPLAIVSENVVRILAAFDWRIRWLHQQLQRAHQVSAHQALPHAMSACEDVVFYLDILLKQYQPGIRTRSLSLADGALIAEACRDIRQALLLLKSYLHDVIA